MTERTCSECGGRVPPGDEGRMSGLCQRCLNGPTPPGSAAAIAALTETLTRPRFHTHCGETHVPGPCNDGITRPTPTTTWPWFCRGPRWFRIKGWGVRYVDHRRHPKLFGERNGYQRALHIGPHCFRWIKP